MLFSAEISHFRTILNVLRSIVITEHVIIRPMEQGLKLTLDEMKCIETSVYIPCSVFSVYKLKNSEDLIFKISLKILVEVLNIFGDEGEPYIKLSYATFGSPLCIVMTHCDENITIDCEIKTMNVDEFNDLSLADECNTNKMVINASILGELMNRLKNSADEVKVSLSPDPPYFTLTMTGVAGESEVSVSKNCESVTVFQCKSPTTAVYEFSNFKHILKVMGYADKVAISTGESGLLGLQLIINNDDQQIYVEYYSTSQYMSDMD